MTTTDEKQSDTGQAQQAGGEAACPPDRRARWKRLARQVAGWTLLVLGVAGLVLPFLQGWLFIGWGTLLLAPDIPWIRRLVVRLERKVPALRSVLRKVRGKKRACSDNARK